MVISTHESDITLKTLPEHSLGQFAYKAIQKHIKKATRYEVEVLQDTDPEPLHQMRVGLRRLRTTLHTYGFVLRLPEEASEPRIKKLAKTLGHVRDLDVLIEKFEQGYRPTLPTEEQHVLDGVLSSQWKIRRKYFSKLVKALNGKQYKRVKIAYEHWLDEPQYQPLANCPVDIVLPDLLLPLVSRLFLHPGWFVGHDLLQDEIDPPTLNRWLDEDGTVLHDLRKQMKQVRYQAEFLEDFYGKALKKPVKQFKDIQEQLGQLQDCWVLNQVLRKEIGNGWTQTLPILAQRLREERCNIWRAWSPMQKKFLDPAYRDRLRCTIAVSSAFDALLSQKQTNQSKDSKEEAG